MYLEDLQIVALRPTVPPPELLTQLISRIAKNVALQDTELSQRCEAYSDHTAAEAMPPVFGLERADILFERFA
ncbi:MAG TPA: hypothetical protein VHX65_13695 [Pirellulales bacterium]|nr:hypothetical protein [Pirellulales bacterium]